MTGNTHTAVIYGGNGFVGTHLAEKMIAQQFKVICVSRSGSMPVHLQGQAWAQQVQWLSGDASQPDTELLASADVLISVVGSPPIPTVGEQAYAKQVFTNGVTNCNALAAAAEAGVKRVVLMGAKIPSILRGDWFGYAKGKRLSFEAAQTFADLTPDHHAVVLQPGIIFGKRHTVTGKQIPIDLVMRPVSKILPSQLVSVQRVADCMVKAALGNYDAMGNFTVIRHSDI